MGTERIGLSPNANHKTGQLNTYVVSNGSTEKNACNIL